MCYIHLKLYDKVTIVVKLITVSIGLVFKAMDSLQNALKLSPQTVTYMELGRVHLLKEDISSALSVYKDAVRYNLLQFVMIRCNVADVIVLVTVQRIQSCWPH